MGVNNILKKEGIKVVKQFSTLEVNLVANKISEMLCNAFPEHNFDNQELFTNLSRLNMYFSEMPNSLSCAKYVAETHSIYFNTTVSLDNIDDLTVHECIHFLQEVKDIHGNLQHLGLAHFTGKVTGIALNEAAVQLMAAEANGNQKDNVTYFNIELSTISPLYYTLECALVSQMAYFTGTYPLYESTINSTNLFENTFSSKSGKSNYITIRNNLDKIVEYEDILAAHINDLKEANDNTKKISKINSAIISKKKDIFNLFLKTQNLIMTSCFDYEFKHVRNKEELFEFKDRLYNYQYIIGTTKDYTFYNDFFNYTMNKFEAKYNYFEKHDYIPAGLANEKSLALCETKPSTFELIKIFLSKVIKLGRLNNSARNSIRQEGK